MPGNLRKKTSGKSGVTERDYLRARRQVIRASSICAICGEAIDKNAKPICRFVDTSDLSMFDEIPRYCSADGSPCEHPRKAHPYSASADHIEQVSTLPPDSPLLVDPRNMQAVHLKCNQSRQSGAAGLNKTSKDWYA